MAQAAESDSDRVRPVVLIATDHLVGPAASWATEAVRSAGGRPVPHPSPSSLEPSETPTLLVAGLAEGARRVPEEIAELLTGALPRVPLLLLCSEPLLRPTMITQGGRIVLLSPPLSPSKIASRVRMLLSGAAGDAGTQASAKQPGFTTREMRRAHFWAGAFCKATARPLAFPFVHEEASTGLTVVLSAESVDRDLADEAIGVLGSSEREPEKELALEKCLGRDRAALHLASGSEHWTFYWPRLDWSLCLFSSQRVPHFTDLGRMMERSFRRVIRIRAAGGDLVSASTAPYASSSAALASMIDGGPALLELAAAERADDRATAGVIAEVF
jgi:hypothetical protein